MSRKISRTVCIHLKESLKWNSLQMLKHTILKRQDSIKFKWIHMNNTGVFSIFKNSLELWENLTSDLYFKKYYKIMNCNIMGCG